jgi:hypothetical protein
MQRIGMVLFLAATCSACLRSTTVISVKPDGSGTIVQETGLSPEALGMMKGMAGERGKMPAELFGEEQSKKTAAAMGVEFVSGEPIKTAQLEGYRARFAFADVRKLRMKMNQDPTGGLSGKGSSAGDSPFGFELENRGASSVLTITVPDTPPGAANAKGTLTGLPAGATPEQNQQAIQMMKLMMQGLFVDVSLDVEGRIIKTNAPHVAGSRVTLLQLDFNKLLADDAALLKFQGASDLKSLADVPGLKVLTTPKVTVEFAK